MGVYNCPLFNNLGLCCFYAQQYDMTLTSFERALSLAEDEEEVAAVWYNLGHIAVVRCFPDIVSVLGMVPHVSLEEVFTLLEIQVWFQSLYQFRDCWESPKLVLHPQVNPLTYRSHPTPCRDVSFSLRWQERCVGGEEVRGSRRKWLDLCVQFALFSYREWGT